MKPEIIYGTRPVIEALEAGKDVDKIFVQKDARSAQMGELLRMARQVQAPISFVPVEKLNRFTRQNHQGVVCLLSPVNYSSIEMVLPAVFEKGETPLVLILDRISDVRNFGAICRSAECTGTHAIIVPTKGAAQINSDAIKASSGAVFNVPVCRVDSLKKTLQFLKNSGLQVVSCTEKAEEYIYSSDFSLPTAIILGSEEDGISPDLLQKSDYLARIPMKGKTSSLNVSVAAGIILYEALRQKNLRAEH
jgi:23S rRNA (guanosine2251-2'-O)-methyltransferase